MVGVGNKDFIKIPADYGISGSYNPSKNLSINANLSKNNVGAGMSYRFENGGNIAQNGKEMQYYQNGLDFQPKTISKNGGWLDKAQTGYQTGDKVMYGTPEYEEAYNKGEVVTEDGQRSPIALDEVVIQNNYKRPRGFWEQSRDKFLKLTDEVDMGKVYDSLFMCPPTYKKVQEGYSDEKGNLFKVDNNTLLLFIEWFIGYNAINNIWTGSNSSYMSSKGISVTTSFYFMSKSTGKKMERINTYDYSSFVKEFKGNFNIGMLRPRYDYTNQSAINYWGNVFFIRKIFTDYYDDYLLSPKTITTTTTTTNKQ